LILHEKLGRPNWRSPFAGTLDLFDPRRLHLEAPVASCARVPNRQQPLNCDGGNRSLCPIPVTARSQFKMDREVT
jgi:hypothetical protein